ncbi:MAG: methyltransferase, TIGR04325 family [Actinobacteria bacterium]|jgi:putative methyltransferase (TIGR04325 family)|nr:methyltransferase, TIGR04325 family [Actinomycetota bacterium]
MDAISLGRTTRFLLKSSIAGLGHSLAPLRAVGGRLRYLSPFPRRFTGAYASFEEAVAAAGTGALVGYNHHEIASVAFEQMCQVMPWDYPVLFWLRNLLDEIDCVVDAGGHMGTKYRAFRGLLPLSSTFCWIVYDVPAIVAAGRQRALRDGLTQLSFVDRIEDAPAASLFLGSGLMQYLDLPLPALLANMQSPPRCLLLNKVAFRRGGAVVTLERIGRAYVPYQIRDEETFLGDLERIGYRLIDRWSIPELSHVIETHPELGPSESAGFYLRRDEDR